MKRSMLLLSAFGISLYVGFISGVRWESTRQYFRWRRTLPLRDKL